MKKLKKKKFKKIFSQLSMIGLKIIKRLSKNKKGKPVNILTHCNAGWLAFVDYGSATAPIYAAYEAGIKVHVWVDETRPRNQGARFPRKRRRILYQAKKRMPLLPEEVYHI